MRIGEAAAQCGLGVETIRYYERVGILPPVPRGPDGQRYFSGDSLGLMELLHLLRETGMPLAEMKRFATLYAQGDATIAGRREVLVRHGARLAERRAVLDQCEALLERKLAIYDALEARG